MPAQDDWRRQGQEKYLKGINLVWKKYTQYRDGWDHDHCEFCGARFMVSDGPDEITEGYTSEDNYRWICNQCYKDFRDEYDWNLKNAV